jgi:DNA-binding winged helix-turn-helix (wHTH) protein
VAAEGIMATKGDWWFGPFRLEGANERLWRGAQVVRLRPKSFAVLGYLIEQAGHLVTREALLQAIWPAVVVSESMLTICIGELRQALEDDARRSSSRPCRAVGIGSSRP